MPRSPLPVARVSAVRSSPGLKQALDTAKAAGVAMAQGSSSQRSNSQSKQQRVPAGETDDQARRRKEKMRAIAKGIFASWCGTLFGMFLLVVLVITGVTCLLLLHLFDNEESTAKPRPSSSPELVPLQGAVVGNLEAVAAEANQRFTRELLALREEVQPLQRQHRQLANDVRKVEASIASLATKKSSAGDGQTVHMGSCSGSSWRDGMIDWAAAVNGATIDQGATSMGVSRSFIGVLIRAVGLVAARYKALAVGISPPAEVVLMRENEVPVHCFALDGPGTIAVHFQQVISPAVIELERAPEWADTKRSSPHHFEVHGMWPQQQAGDGGYHHHVGSYEYSLHGPAAQAFFVESPVPLQGLVFHFTTSWGHQQTEVCRIRVLAPSNSTAAIPGSALME
mmetsp:Transcript_16007/g.37743  ORF Transcript_16007/g.37743 Transcript_16007/m.37743 type:complete len:397 (+) Transcript_16007:72-1262(+)